MEIGIRQMLPQDVHDVVSICEEELVLDADASMFPVILMRRPHISLIAVHELEPIAVCFGSISEEDGSVGFIDLLVVSASQQRHGVGRQLVGEMEKALASRGCTKVRIEGHPPHYIWPGIDIHYTPAICFAQKLGYSRGRCEVNMDVDLLSVSLETEADEERLRLHAIDVRRAVPEEAADLDRSLAKSWKYSWVAEAKAALLNEEAALFIAVQNSECVAFCAYGTNRIHQIGPMGTRPDVRRLGIGSVLLKRCLAEQRRRGLSIAELQWVGPLWYFSTLLNARIGRAFWQYEIEILAASHRVHSAETALE